MTQIGSTWTEAFHGGLEMGAALLTPFRRSRRRRWGATEDEAARSYPGDELVPDPTWTAHHAISIDARPEGVWPWIAQIGQGRGGFYSYQQLENLAGSEIENTSRILDEHQQVGPGDEIRLHADIPPMVVADVQEPTTLVLFGDPSGAGDDVALTTTWAFLILEQPDGSSRLISRTRYRHGPGVRSALTGGPVLIEPVSFVMERKMLSVIKGLVEASS